MNESVKIAPTSAIGACAPLVLDRFASDLRAGTVIGSRATSGAVRLGCDAERQIAVDTGALRFQPLLRAGWGRQGIAYGPFRREAGLTLAVSITNGHNTSQGTSIPESLVRRLHRWAVGPNADPLPRRMAAWMRGPRRKGSLRRFLWWARSTPKAYKQPEFHENLAVGFFTSPVPRDPLTDGCGFIVHAAEGENGELWARTGARCLSAFRRLKNLQIYYVVALRERGAIYYAAAMPGAVGVAGFPMLRPVAIDAFNEDQVLFAGIHQCVLGQIGFRVDTRVQGVQIGRIPELASGFGTASVGDRLTGDGPIVGAGLPWETLQGTVERSGSGAVAVDGEALVAIDAGFAPGLVHALVDTGESAGAVGLAWRVEDAGNLWIFRISADGSTLVRRASGVERLVASDGGHGLRPDATHALQILDDGRQIGCYLDGERVFDGWIEDSDLADATRTGFWLGCAGGPRVRGFEAHPREVPMPPAIAFDPPWARFGQRIECADDFAGPAGELAGRVPARGQGPWQKSVGVGGFDLDGLGGARVRASVEVPHPGRTFYTLPWRRPDFADLAVTITPPGSARGQRQYCRAGLVFWQDPDNYISLTTYVDDDYNGSSVALFTKRHGFEELYDAIWTMLWDKVDWGKPVRLRIPFDGDRFVVYLGDEPVMQRALTDLYPDDPPLRITRVGLAVNWEWATDTGSTFRNFVALG